MANGTGRIVSVNENRDRLCGLSFVQRKQAAAAILDEARDLGAAIRQQTLAPRGALRDGPRHRPLRFEAVEGQFNVLLSAEHQQRDDGVEMPLQLTSKSGWRGIRLIVVYLSVADQVGRTEIRGPYDDRALAAITI
jgi:predicted phage tail protein